MKRQRIQLDSIAYTYRHVHPVGVCARCTKIRQQRPRSTREPQSFLRTLDGFHTIQRRLGFRALSLAFARVRVGQYVLANNEIRGRFFIRSEKRRCTKPAQDPRGLEIWPVVQYNAHEKRAYAA